MSQKFKVDSVLKLANLANENKRKCDFYNQASELLSVDDPDKSIKYAEKASQLAFSIKYNEGIAESYYNVGRANERISNFSIAFEKYFSALVLYENLEIESEIATINYRIAVLFKNTSNYYKALEYCLTALPLMEKQDDKIGISHIYNTLGSIYKYLNNNEKALEYYLECANIQMEHRAEGVSAAAYNNIGIVYVRKKKYVDAMDYHLKSMEIRQNNKDELGIAHSNNNIGIVLLEEGKFDSAFTFFQKSLEMKKGLKDKRGQAHTYHNIGEYYFKTGNIKKSLEYIDSSTSLAKKNNIMESVKNNYELLSDIYFEKGQYDSSLANYKRFSDLKNSIQGPEISIKVTQLEQNYEKSKVLALRKLNDQKKRLVNIIIYGALIFILFVIFLVYRNLKNRYKLDKLKQAKLEIEKENLLTKIEMKDKELARNIIHLSEKNESIINIRKILIGIENKLKDENKPLIRSVINKLSGSINSNIWDEFDYRFVNVYSKFYDKLLQEHPDVTANEKRLAAFLKLNMSSKEISMITKQSVHSITVARTRLRKKIGLANKEVSLVSYFSAL